MENMSKDNFGKPLLSEVAEKLASFSTEGMVKYNSQGFKEYVEENKIDPGLIIDELLNEDLLKRDFEDLSEYNAYKVLDAFSASLPQKAEEYLERKLDFVCSTPEDFYEKRRFLNLLNMYFLNILWLGVGGGSEENINSAEQNMVFKKFKESFSAEKGSVLLNVFAKRLRNEYLGKGKGLGSDADNFTKKPYLAAPRVYAFDTEKSFWLLNPHKDNDKEHGYYVSDKEYYQEIKSVLDNLKEGDTLYGDYGKISEYFHRATKGEINALPLDKDEPIKRSDREMVEYRELNSPLYRNSIKEFTGMNLEELDLPVQFHLLNYLKTLDLSDFDRVKDFGTTFGNAGLSAFLSMEHGGQEMGSVLLGLGEKYKGNEDLLKNVFEKYNAIVKATKELPEDYFDESVSFLYKKGSSLLQKAYKAEDLQDFAKELGFYEARVVALGAEYKQDRAVKGKESLRRGFDVVLLGKTELEKYGKYMTDVTIENRKVFMSEEKREIRKEKFLNSLENPKAHFYAYIREGKPVAFASFTETEDGLLAESLNIDPVLKKETGMGGDFFAAITKRLGVDYKIIGFVNEGNKSLLGYYESIGYSRLDTVNKDGVNYIPITYDKSAITSAEPQPLAKAA